MAPCGGRCLLGALSTSSMKCKPKNCPKTLITAGKHRGLAAEASDGVSPKGNDTMRLVVVIEANPYEAKEGLRGSRREPASVGSPSSISAQLAQLPKHHQRVESTKFSENLLNF